MSTAAPQRVSVIIPVYRGSSTAVETVKTLAADPYQQKEIIVTVDEPERGFVNEIKKAGAIVLEYDKRRGKVTAANEAAKMASGEILVFLDSDIVVEPGFLTKAIPELEGYDLVEFAKAGIGDGIISALASIDYIIYDAMLELGSRITGHSIMMNGSAFMIRKKAFEAIGGFRRMYSEDLDFAVRSLKHNLRYKLARTPMALVKQPKTFSDWVNQRIRWGYGLAEWARVHVKDLLGSTGVLSLLFLSMLVILIPSMTAAGLMYMLSTPVGAPLISYVEVAIYTYRLVPVGHAMLEPGIIKIAFALVVTPAIVIPAYYMLHRAYKAHTNLLYLLVYYYVYQPLLASIYIIGAILYLLKLRIDLEWVV